LGPGRSTTSPRPAWSPDDATIVLTLEVDMDPIVLLADGPLSITVS
jgi:hypothetical protein